MSIDSVWKPFRETAERPWSGRQAAHLLRRAGFGGSIREIEQAKKEGLSATLDRLFDLGPAKAYETEMEKSGRLVASGTESNALAAWWALRMTQTPCPLLEKMALFWHGHFATGADKVADARSMYNQNNLLRRHALGNFKPMVQAISRDPAMLVYLDSTENRKTRPNENYARELMELFCLGPGNYSEDDIKEIARCFTGWEVRRHKFRFNSHQHDTKPKTFLDETGNFDGDQAVEIVLKQKSAARFIAGKLIRFFMYDEKPISAQQIEGVAQKIRDSNWEIAPVLRMIFSSEGFYSDDCIGKKIKSPVELGIGFLRLINARVNTQQLCDRFRQLGQLPLFPPNVAGWEGGRTWINASTVLARANLALDVLQSSKTNFESGDLHKWKLNYRTIPVASAPDWVEEFVLATKLPSEVKERLNELGFSNHKEIARYLTIVTSLPEFQLN